MSIIDYNEKFKQLRKKISLISDTNSDISKKTNFYKNKIKYLELNTQQKLESISNKITSLKNDFIKINNQILSNNNDNNNTFINKNNSFYYPSLKKKKSKKKKIL